MPHTRGYLFLALIALVGAFTAWRVWDRRKKEKKARPLPYRVVKPPSSLAGADRDPGKRVVAVVGGTGFVCRVVDRRRSRSTPRLLRNVYTNPALIHTGAIHLSSCLATRNQRHVSRKKRSIVARHTEYSR